MRLRVFSKSASRSGPILAPLGEKTKAQSFRSGPFIYPGGDLLSHDLSIAVPSALEDLTSVFEMGTGVTPPA